MPRAQYRWESQNISSEGTFSTPVKVSSLSDWLISAARVVKLAPVEVHRGQYRVLSGWAMRDAVVTERAIRFDFVRSDGERSYLVIDRKFAQIS